MSLLRGGSMASGRKNGFLFPEEMTLYRQEINIENRKAIHMFAYGGLIIALLNMAAQAIVRGVLIPPAYSFFLPGVFVILILLDRFVLPQNYPHSTLVLYLFQAVLMLSAILLGTVMDPRHQATTILLFITLMPAMILDTPVRSFGMECIFCIIFAIFSAMYKEPYLFLVDTVHVAEFLFASLVVTMIVTRIRLGYLMKIGEIRYVADHDPLTGCYARHAMRTRLDRYLNQPAAITVCSLENVSLYSDFYGHDTGNEMLVRTVNILSSVFGEEDTYRYQGMEYAAVIPGGTEAEILEKITMVRKRAASFDIRNHHIVPVLNFGYVTGTPKDVDNFRQMIRLAEIHLHKASKSGANQTVGSIFDEAALQTGIVESSLSMHAPSYEINPLTGLPGMSYFTVRAEEMLHSIVNLSESPVVGYVRLRGLRKFNNMAGYKSGDQLIMDTGRLLSKACSKRLVCYITAGRFCIMIYRKECEEVIENVNSLLQDLYPGYDIQVMAGFAEYTGSESVISLLDSAKLASQDLKRKKENIRFFDQEMQQKHTLREYVLSHVDEAVENGYLKVYFQPIVRTITGRVCNEEALSRWVDPVYGFLTPNVFVPPLEEAALMYKVNLNVVQQVLDGFRLRQKLHVPIVPVSINLSRTDFEQCDMVQAISNMCDEAGVDHSMIKIEITESAFTRDNVLMKKAVHDFRSLGFEVWMDDFGSEYSTLNLLQETEFDLLKIDMQFMKNFAVGSRNHIIVSDIIDMAKRMGITTLIEGVETKEHYELLKRMGCEKIQGFYFNRPNPQNYITEKALSGTGLKFEEPETAGYYADIGRIDLHNPSGHPGLGDTDSSLPCAVIEYQNARAVCLTETDAFRRIMAEHGWMSHDPQDQAVSNPPYGMISAAGQCVDLNRRYSFSVEAQDGYYTFYLRRISEYENHGARALLCMILKNQSA